MLFLPRDTSVSHRKGTWSLLEPDNPWRLLLRLGRGEGGTWQHRLLGASAASPVWEGRNMFWAASFYPKDKKPTQDPILPSE